MLWPTPDQLNATLAQAIGNLSTLDPKTCQWPDLNYSTRGPENWDPVLHMFRISTMTAALTVPGGRENDTVLLWAVHCALRVWIEQDWQNPNWWWNYIQDPLIATGIMLMLGVERMSSEEINAIIAMSYRANWWIKDWGGGANLVWELQVQLYRGLATSNYSAVAQGFEVMWNTVQIQNLSTWGVQTDWSYHFHGPQILTGAYGDAWATNILHFHLATRGTQYALSQDRIDIFGRFLTEGDAWFTMGSVWTWGILGRVIDRGVHVWYTHLFPSDQLRALAMDVSSAYTAFALLDYADRLEHRHEARPLVGNRHFYTSDFQVHRRGNWTAALKMHSFRTIATECDNNENLNGEHIGDGVLNLYTRDAQYGSGEEYENIFALLDWKTINGITVEADTPLVRCNRVCIVIVYTIAGKFLFALLEKHREKLNCQEAYSKHMTEVTKVTPKLLAYIQYNVTSAILIFSTKKDNTKVADVIIGSMLHNYRVFVISTGSKYRHYEIVSKDMETSNMLHMLCYDCKDGPNTGAKLIFRAVYKLFGLANLAMCVDLIHEEIRAKFRWLNHKIGIIEGEKDLVVTKKDKALDNNKRPSTTDCNPVMNTNDKMIENENEARKLMPNNNIAHIHPIKINSNKETLHQRAAATKGKLLFKSAICR
ncbi:unnamed protein product [Rotaria sp. Silwood1]|nr:unnamed protein product [Rotaria sp. Silwood1]CAF1421045.1 unnamed protein product [Rotaria sp. Silwood1]